MTIWGISDLHLSLARPMPRDHFAARWKEHSHRIAEEWQTVVTSDDLVLLPGDISMARNHREIQPDLAWLARRPGLKVLSPGNHDQWFNQVEAVRTLLRPGTFAVRGDALRVAGLVVAGARSTPATLPDPTAASQEAESTAIEELKSSLNHAAQLRTAGEPLVVLWHHPPFNRFGTPGPIVPLLEEAEVTTCLYGHLHALDQWSRAAQGIIGGVRYYCVAADAVGFRPLKIRPGG